MAYAEQQGYRAAQRPQYQYPPNSYASSHQPHTAEYDYAPEPSDFNGRPQPGPPQQYRDEYELEGEDSSHDQDRWQGANGGGHGRRGRDDVGGPPVQPSRQRPADAHPYVDARNRGQARSKSRPPERTRNFGPEPQGFQQRHHPETSSQNGSGGKYNGNYNYNEASYGHQDGWDMNQQYNTSMTGSQAYHGPQNGAEYRGKGHSDHSAQNAFQDYHEVIPESNSQGPPRSAHGKPPSVSSKSEISQRSRACKFTES